MSTNRFLTLAVTASLTLMGSCDGPGPTTPPRSPPEVPVLPLPNFPQVHGNPAVYVRPNITTCCSSTYGENPQRYLVYGDSTFRFQSFHSSREPWEFFGRYSRADSVIVFDYGFDGVANGIVKGDSLTVSYPAGLFVNGALDAVYLLDRSAK